LDVTGVPPGRARGAVLNGDGLPATRRAARKVCIVALSYVPTDPRPRRHADLLHDLGVDVTVVGYPGVGGAAYGWRYVTVEPAHWSLPGKAAEVLRMAAARASAGLGRMAHAAARRHRDLDAVLASVDADAFVTHDYAALPAAMSAARRRGGIFAYDCREFYAGQHADQLLWRLVAPPSVRAVEGGCIRDAAWVTTVSDGLADLLVRQYGLRQRPTVVRSTPARTEIDAHDVGASWVVLFHGHVRPDRNVHGLVRSVPLWPDHLRLEIRGDGPSDYLADLQAMVRELGVGDRVALSPAVPYGDVIRSASLADIGVIPWTLDQPQKQISLPNKLFEYLMAGLAVVATAPSEASRLVESRGAGLGYAPATPGALAQALASLTSERLRALRQGAMTAREELSWEHESQVLRDLWLRQL
jgi:glycosyltransferase involved in cell wall biosynthesis